MAKLSAEERALLKRLMEEEVEEAEEQEESEPQEREDGASEDFIVFRGSADAFKKAFGFGIPTEPSEPAEEEEEDPPKKREPKSRGRSKYFG
ncbi:hypothetical protein AB0A70_06775 [Streptomyces morookaense]|uniref:hypothetical protein n=1 Tax=Streptomyces morookaense TaxID=1970 RepID=UPI00340B9A4B